MPTGCLHNDYIVSAGNLTLLVAVCLGDTVCGEITNTKRRSTQLASVGWWVWEACGAEGRKRTAPNTNEDTRFIYPCSFLFGEQEIFASHAIGVRWRPHGCEICTYQPSHFPTEQPHTVGCKVPPKGRKYSSPTAANTKCLLLPARQDVSVVVCVRVCVCVRLLADYFSKSISPPSHTVASPKRRISYTQHTTADSVPLARALTSCLRHNADDSDNGLLRRKNEYAYHIFSLLHRKSSLDYIHYNFFF